MAAPLLDLTTLGLGWGWSRGEGDWGGVGAAIDRGDPVQVIQEAGPTEWQAQLPADHPFQFGFPEFSATVQETRPTPKARIWISLIQRRFAPESDLPKVQWHPRLLWVGLGCERGTPKPTIAQAIATIFRSHHLAEGAIAGIASLDRKAEEAGLLEFCRDRGLPIRFFSAEQLQAVPVPHASLTVAAAVETPSVAEAAAIFASGQSSLRVAKQIFCPNARSKSVTIAIAEADQASKLDDDR